MLLEALEWQNIKRGYHYEWMSNMHLLQTNQKVKAGLDRHLLKRVFR